MRKLLALALLLAGTTSAGAAATPWQQVAPGARLRLITSDVRQPDGTTLVGLELDMPQSFKTYWQFPGESGIPTEFDTAGSSGVTAAAIAWPYPAPEETQGLLDYVYHGQTVLPVSLKTTGAAPLLRAAVVMGVCSDVCMPVRASFTLPLSFATADAGEALRLRQAAALAPLPWAGAAPAFTAVDYDAAARVLRLAGVDPAIDPASVIVSTSDPAVLFDAPQKSPVGPALVLPLRGEARGTGWTAAPITLTFLTARGSFAVSRRVAPAQ